MKYWKVICLEAEITVIAKDEEEAAFVALELANSQDFTLVDIEPVEIDKKSGYYPNKWQAIKDIDDDLLEDVSFEEFFEWRVCSHELLDGFHSVIRIYEKNGRIKEKAYKSRSAAMNFVKRLMANPDVKFDVCTDKGVVGFP